jgi:hypothetical protein
MPSPPLARRQPQPAGANSLPEDRQQVGQPPPRFPRRPQHPPGRPLPTTADPSSAAPTQATAVTKHATSLATPAAHQSRAAVMQTRCSRSEPHSHFPPCVRLESSSPSSLSTSPGLLPHTLHRTIARLACVPPPHAPRPATTSRPPFRAVAFERHDMVVGFSHFRQSRNRSPGKRHQPLRASTPHVEPRPRHSKTSSFGMGQSSVRNAPTGRPLRVYGRETPR